MRALWLRFRQLPFHIKLLWIVLAVVVIGLLVEFLFVLNAPHQAPLKTGERLKDWGQRQEPVKTQDSTPSKDVAAQRKAQPTPAPAYRQHARALQQLAGRLHTQLRDTLVHFQQTEDRQNLIQAYHAATDTIMGRWRDGSLAILGRVPEGRAALYRRLEAEASQALERLSSTRQRGYELLLHRFSDPRAEELYPDYAPPTPSGTTDATGAQAPDTIHMPAPQRLPR